MSNDLELYMKLVKLKLKDNDILSIKFNADNYPVDSKGNEVSTAEFHDQVYKIFKDMYPDLDIAILMNTDVEHLDEEDMNKLGWYRRD